ncbi:uracil-DNA glycosylase [Simkania negevensis]|uniref:Type-5 uracil-DNA glycosylase n=1 Tax=Simkania negevensis (strain ATCC VR-1471 / DSM 27360 / Z) TaxID=331113 RepID=F8L8C6_SIMNZ|nr:uracil-DNA glycosylase [Simkania negevensis]CCB89049.1 uncharacterized protein Mb1289 [Simkania negevensis Z]
MTLSELNQIVSACRKCPRLVEYRETLPKRSAYKDEAYLREPTPGYGDPKARLLILGLAPSAHGGNRTGRIFTGDESARFLMKMLYQVGFANQPTSFSRDDGLKLSGCYITAAVKCAPPENRPLKEECDNCLPYLKQEFALLPHLKAVLALGELAYKAIFSVLNKENLKENKLPFKHASLLSFGEIDLFTSYHPSPQNTYTGKLTEEMFISVLNQIKRRIDL